MWRCLSRCVPPSPTPRARRCRPPWSYVLHCPRCHRLHPSEPDVRSPASPITADAAAVCCLGRLATGCPPVARPTARSTELSRIACASVLRLCPRLHASVHWNLPLLVFPLIEVKMYADEQQKLFSFLLLQPDMSSVTLFSCSHHHALSKVLISPQSPQLLRPESARLKGPCPRSHHSPASDPPAPQSSKAFLPQDPKIHAKQNKTNKKVIQRCVL